MEFTSHHECINAPNNPIIDSFDFESLNVITFFLSPPHLTVDLATDFSILDWSRAIAFWKMEWRIICKYPSKLNRRQHRWHRVLHSDTRTPPSEWSPFHLWILVAHSCCLACLPFEEIYSAKSLFSFRIICTSSSASVLSNASYLAPAKKTEPPNKLLLSPEHSPEHWATAEVRQQYYFIYMQINPIFSFAHLRKHTQNESIRRRLCRRKSQQTTLERIRCVQCGQCGVARLHILLWICIHCLPSHWKWVRFNWNDPKLLDFQTGVIFFCFSSSIRKERNAFPFECKCIRRGWIDFFRFRRLATNHEKCQFHNSPFNMWFVGTVTVTQKHYSQDSKMQIYLCSKRFQ